MKHAQELGKVFCAKIDDCNLNSVTDEDSVCHRLTCKGIITTNVNNHPVDRDLVCIRCIPSSTSGTSDNFPVMFGIVESTSKSKQFIPDTENVLQSSEVPTKSSMILTLSLCINRHNDNFHFLSDNLNVEIVTTVSMSSFIRQWEGLIVLSRNMLCRDILHPRHPRYFGHFDDLEQIENNATNNREHKVAEFLFNASQFEAITLATKALSLPYCVPQIVLLQGPPGTGKTHTIIGLITSFFANQKANASANTNPLPGGTLKPPSPHLLVCAPSNAAVDVVVNRLLTNGLVIGTDHWKSRQDNMKKHSTTTTTANATDGFRVLRVGVPEKIDPKVLPISLDEVVKKKDREGKYVYM